MGKYLYAIELVHQIFSDELVQYLNEIFLIYLFGIETNIIKNGMVIFYPYSSTQPNTS
jgi:hypothetical protein